MREHRDVAAVREFNRFYTRQLGILDRYLDSPFSLAEARVLYELRYRPDAPTASDLARDLGMDPGYLSRMLRGFARRGLIARETPSHDARRAHLSLTKKGRATFDPLDRRSSAEVRALIDRLPPDNRRSVIDAMGAIQRTLGAPERSRLPAPGSQPFIVRTHRPVKCRRPICFGQIHVGPVLQQRANRVAIARLDGVDERSATTGGRHRCHGADHNEESQAAP